MKTHPIIFSTTMVQAILEGRKTMTRRVVKPQAKNNDFKIEQNDSWGFVQKKQIEFSPDKFEIIQNWKCPYGQPGDVLWVRETWTEVMVRDEEGLFYVFKADGDDWAAPFSPSIHMPRTACRIFLEVVSIRVEQLLSISFEDAEKEGILGLNCCERYFDYVSEDYTKPNALASFSSLWVSINGEKSWNSNPWVWVIEFKRIDKPENF